MRARIVTYVAARELREAVRSRWFLAAGVAFCALSLALAGLGLSGAERSGLAGFDRTTASMLNLSLLFVPLLTLSVGALSLAAELEEGTLGMLLAEPVTRAEVYLGKYLGQLAAISAAVCGGYGAAGLVIGLLAGGDRARAFVSLVALTLMLSAATLAMGTLLGAWLRSTSRVMGAAFGAWLLLVYGSDLGAIGLTLARHLRPAQVFTLSLFNPVQQARVLGTLALSQRLDLLGPVGIYGQDHFGTAGLVAFLYVLLAATTLVALGAGYERFRRAVVP
jgi:Cu-processing system permease protein